MSVWTPISAWKIKILMVNQNYEIKSQSLDSLGTRTFDLVSHNSDLVTESQL